MIYQADTYRYDMKHFGKSTECTRGEPGQCFQNVFAFAKHYKDLGKDMDVVLTIGGRSWCDSSVFCYHFLLQDVETKEYVDPQYGRYTFLPLHKWSLTDYQRETNEFSIKYEYSHAEEFAAWYCENHRAYFEAGCLMIRALADFNGPTKKTIQETIRGFVGYGVKPMLGESLVHSVIFD